MDELDVITELTPEAPLPAERDLSAAKARLFAEFDAAPRKRSSHRFAWIGGVTAVAAAAAVAVALAPSAPAPAPSAPNPAPHHQQQPPVELDAATILTNAARTARAEPAVTPRPDQFVYVKSQDGDNLYQAWISVDGTRDGLVRTDDQNIALPGCRNSKKCQPVLGYDPNLPTDPNALIAYLEHGRTVDLHTASGVNTVAKDVESLFDDTYVPPDVQSALFTAIAKIPGLSVDHDTPAGTIGVRWSYDGSAEMLFSTAGGTYRYAGSKTVSPKGDVGISTLLQVGIVDKVGDRPE